VRKSGDLTRRKRSRGPSRRPELSLKLNPSSVVTEGALSGGFSKRKKPGQCSTTSANPLLSCRFSTKRTGDRQRVVSGERARGAKKTGRKTRRTKGFFARAPSVTTAVPKVPCAHDV
jgi:hypothetical protein